MKSKCLSIILATALTSSVSFASVSINFGIGDMYGSTDTSSPFSLGGRLNLLALTNGGSWGTSANISTVLSNLTASFVPSGAVLVGSAFFSDNSFGSGTAQTTINFSYGSGFTNNQPMLIVGYSSLNNTATQPGFGTAGFFYRSDVVQDFSDIAFISPADGGSYTLNALTLSQSGSLANDALTSGTGATGGNGFTTVPEPSTYALLAMSALGLGGYVVRRRNRS